MYRWRGELDRYWIEDLEVYTLAIDPITPTTIYAGTWDGVYRSTDGEDNWAAVNTGLADLTVENLVIDPLTPATIYAVTKNGGIFKSIDGGDSWTNAELAGWDNPFCNSLARDPITPTTIYAATDDGVFRLSVEEGTP